MTAGEILNQVQDVLIEPRDEGVSFPSGLWEPEEIVNYLNQRQNRFLKATLLQVGDATIDVTAGVGTYPLPQDWLTTVDVYWQTPDGRITPIERGDSFEADHAIDAWATSRGTPQLYFDEDSPLLSIRLAPLPHINGRLLLLYIPQAAPIVTEGEHVNDQLTIPAEYVHAVCKYGVLADAFGKDGRGASPEKAQYCAGRFQLGVEMAGILLQGWTP